MDKVHWNVGGKPACDLRSDAIKRVRVPALTKEPDAVTCATCPKWIGMTDRSYEEVAGIAEFDTTGRVQ